MMTGTSRIGISWFFRLFPLNLPEKLISFGYSDQIKQSWLINLPETKNFEETILEAIQSQKIK